MKIINLHENLIFLRNVHNFSQEQLAEKIAVSRQTIAKWETGETLPDIIKCQTLATLYDVSLEDLLYFKKNNSEFPIPPKGKHIFGTTKVGERGQIVLPKQARDIMNIEKGETLVVLGDENPESFGIALVPSKYFLHITDLLKESFKSEEE